MEKSIDVDNFANSQSVLLGSFMGEATYSVPPLQRNYSWSTEEADALWTDITQHAASDIDYYFLGNVIFFISDEGRVIVDGQQRLATATILLCAARDAIHRSAKAGELDLEADVTIHGQEYGLDEVLAQLANVVKDFGKRGRFRLTLKQNDSARLSWIQTAEDKRGRQPHSRGRPKIYRVYSRYLSTASELLQKKKLDNLCGVVYDLLNRVVITRTRVPNLVTAYTIFSTTNTRGKDLTLADIVRAGVLEQWQKLGNSEAPVDIVQMLNRFDLVEYDELPQFMRRYWILRNGKKSSPAQTNKQVVDFIKSVQTNKSLSSFVSEMSDMVEAYARFLEIVGTRPTTEIERRLAMFDLSGFQQHVPAFMAIINDDKLEDPSAEALLSTIESIFMYHNVLLDASPSAIEDMFAVLAQRVHKDGANAGRKQLEDSFSRLTGRPLKSKRWFVRAFSQAELGVRSAAFVLRRIEKARWTKELTFDLYRPKALNLEHVLPQSPDPKEWPEKWQDEDTLNQFLWLPGNLTLLAQPLNGRVKNAGFETKKAKGYSKSDVKIARELSSNKSWDESEIQNRSTSLAKEAADLWSWT